jgi:hypothetical protein
MRFFPGGQPPRPPVARFARAFVCDKKAEVSGVFLGEIITFITVYFILYSNSKVHGHRWLGRSGYLPSFERAFFLVERNLQIPGLLCADIRCLCMLSRLGHRGSLGGSRGNHIVTLQSWTVTPKAVARLARSHRMQQKSYQGKPGPLVLSIEFTKA